MTEWKLARFEIDKTNAPGTVGGLVYRGALGIHRSAEGISVTHLYSGRRILSPISDLDAAVAFAELLYPEAEDWKAEEPKWKAPMSREKAEALLARAHWEKQSESYRIGDREHGVE